MKKFINFITRLFIAAVALCYKVYNHYHATMRYSNVQGNGWVSGVRGLRPAMWYILRVLETNEVHNTVQRNSHGLTRTFFSPMSLECPKKLINASRKLYHGCMCRLIGKAAARGLRWVVAAHYGRAALPEILTDGHGSYYVGYLDGTGLFISHCEE